MSEIEHFKERTMADIRVGSLAIAKRTAGEWSVDESAVCFEIYEMEEGRVGYSFVFEKGGYDGFNLEEVDTYLHVTGECSAALADYRFIDDTRLSADHAAGVFQPAFALASPHAVANENDLPDPPETMVEESARRVILK
jgi:hypothetical protein